MLAFMPDGAWMKVPISHEVFVDAPEAAVRILLNEIERATRMLKESSR